MQRITNNWQIIVVRFALGVFLAFFMAAIVFVIARLFIVVPTPSATLITIGIGAGVGGAIGWVNPASPKWAILLLFAAGVLGALGGAWGGMIYGKTVFIMGGMPGIGEMAGIVRGAAIGGNILPIIIGLVRIMKGGD